jgi:hypothetical protein
MPSPKPNRKGLLAALMFCTFLVQITLAVTMDFIVHVPKVVTDGSVTQFDVFGEGVGAQIFTLILRNPADTIVNNLYLNYKVDYCPPQSGLIKLYEGESNVFSMDVREVIYLSSTRFLDKGADKASLITDVYELPDGELKDKLYASQKMPDGIVRYTMRLQGDGIDIKKYSDHTIINASTITLISPGASPSGPVISIIDPHPVFTWTSDLVSSINQDLFEIRVYEARSGESYTEAMSRRPVVQERTSTFSFRYPYTGHQLQSGFTYYWEVIGFPASQLSEELKSDPFCFKMIKTVNPKVQEVINILKQYPQEYTSDVLNKILSYDSDVILKISGGGSTKAISTQELWELIGKFISGEHSVLSTTVY